MTTRHILLMDEKPIPHISDVISETLEDEEDMHVTIPATILEDVVKFISQPFDLDKFTSRIRQLLAAPPSLS